MSGGAFDYQDNWLDDLADKIITETSHVKTSSTRDKILILAEHVREVGNVLHDLDWWISGDTGEEYFLASVEKLLPNLKQKQIDLNVEIGKAVIEELKELIGRKL